VNFGIAGPFWKGAEMSRRAQLGKGVLSYSYPLAENQNLDFQIVV